LQAGGAEAAVLHDGLLVWLSETGKFTLMRRYQAAHSQWHPAPKRNATIPAALRIGSEWSG
jgi:hypothetical protein